MKDTDRQQKIKDSFEKQPNHAYQEYDEKGNCTYIQWELYDDIEEANYSYKDEIKVTIFKYHTFKFANYICFMNIIHIPSKML